MGAAPVIEHRVVRTSGTGTHRRGSAARPRHLHAVGSSGSGPDLLVAEAVGARVGHVGPQPQPQPRWRLDAEDRSAALVTAPVAPVVSAARPPLMLTRRGRRSLLGLIAVSLAAVLFFAGGGMASTTEPALYVEVESGQTLWDIATEHFPEQNTRSAMTSIQLANGMSTDQIYVGQVLQIPPRD